MTTNLSRQMARDASHATPLKRVDAWVRGVWEHIGAWVPMGQTPSPAYVLVPVSRRAPSVVRRDARGYQWLS